MLLLKITPDTCVSQKRVLQTHLFLLSKCFPDERRRVCALVHQYGEETKSLREKKAPMSYSSSAIQRVFTHKKKHTKKTSKIHLSLHHSGVFRDLRPHCTLLI